MRSMRRGACPSLAAPMPTGDGLLVRLSPVDRTLSGEALRGLTEAAARFGNGLVEVTARGSLQVRGLTGATAPRLAAAVADLGIEVPSGIPVDTGPLAGLDPMEVEDPRPLASELRRVIGRAGPGVSADPKVSIVIDGGGVLHLEGLSADIRLKARGGGQWSTGETVARDPLRHALERLGVIAARGRMAVTAHGTPAEAVGWHRLRGDRVAVGVGLPFGQASAEALGALAGSVACGFRLAPGRAILAVGLDVKQAEAWTREAAGLGFVTEPTDPRRAIAACPGCPACGSGEIPSRALAEEIAAEAPALLDGSFTLHVSGCAKGCAYPRPSVLSVTGVGGRCELSLLGSRLAELRPSAVPGAMAGLQELVSVQRSGGESVADCLARMGSPGPARRLVQERAHARV